MKLKEPCSPTGTTKFFFRLPIWIYRLGLGPVLGNRFILLTHLGRVSGKPKQTVLEIIQLSKDQRKCYVASGFGESSQWFKNLLVQPFVTITRGHKRRAVIARIVEPEEAIQILSTYAQKHPKALRAVARLSGFKIDNIETDLQEFSQFIKIVEFSEV